MYKSLGQNNSYVRKIETFADQALTSASSGVNFFTGISGSTQYISSSNWNWTNVLFYNTEMGDNVSYKSSWHQSRTLDIQCRVIAIPVKNFGKRIKPGTFKLSETNGGTTYQFADDEDGNIYSVFTGSATVKGNIFYGHGIIVMTDTGSIESIIGTDTTMTFKSSFDVFEQNYVCRIGAGEMNASMNPTAVYGDSGSTSTLASNLLRYPNGPTFITTIGLYNEDNHLVAIGRLARPIVNDKTQDLSIHIKFDL